MIHPRKIFTVASTEFGTAVRSKSFLISILVLPIIMGLSIVLQTVVADRADTKTRRVAVIDGTGSLYADLDQAAAARNETVRRPDGTVSAPLFELSRIDPGSEPLEAVLLGLSEQVRGEALDAFVEIPAEILDPDFAGSIRYFSNNPNDNTVRGWLQAIVNDQVRNSRYRDAGLDRALAERLGRPVLTENLGLVSRERTTDASTPGTIRQAEKIDPIRTAAVPAVLLFVVFFIVMTSAPQLLNSVIEEKMSRISEVLLGSVTPFELMMGKLLGNVGIAMVLGLLYVGSGYGLAAYHGYADAISPRLMVALVGFIVLAIVLYGSLYMAVGSACSDLKDAQSLMMPVMLLSILPVLVWTAVLRNPASPLSVGMSLFPFATPFLMLMRLGLQPSPPAWQVVLSIVLTTGTAVACVWAAGKIFRTGLLMQGKPPSLRELGRWVLAR